MPDPTACSIARTINGGAGRVGRQTCSRADCYAAVRLAFRGPLARLSINAITASSARAVHPVTSKATSERPSWLTWCGVGETDRAVTHQVNAR